MPADLGIYDPPFPRSVSLADCEGDKNAPQIEFTSDVSLPIGSSEYFKKLLAGDGIRIFSSTMPLYHAHVLWAYKLCLGSPKGEDHAILYLDSWGPHAGEGLQEDPCIHENENKPKQQQEPTIRSAALTFLLGPEKKEGETVEFIRVAAKKTTYVLKDQNINGEKLLGLAVNGIIHARLRIIIDRSYFDLSKIADLSEPTLSRPAEASLKGERYKNPDWIISTPPRDREPAADFHVHKDCFAKTSPAFKTALANGRSLPGVIEMVPGENRCVLPAFNKDSIDTVLYLIYDTPPFVCKTMLTTAETLDAIAKLFSPRTLTEVVYPAWEHFICYMLHYKVASTRSDIRRFLFMSAQRIFSCPYGSMPAAKRLVIGMIADEMHRDVASGNKLEDLVISTMKHLYFAMPGMVGQTKRNQLIIAAIAESINTHLKSVSQVRKRGVNVIENDSDLLDVLLRQLDIQKLISPAIPPTRSLEDAEEEIGHDERSEISSYLHDCDETIEFEATREFPLPNVRNMASGDVLISIPNIALYYRHVLWCYALRLEKDDNGKFLFSLVSLGPHTRSDKAAKPVPDRNSPSRLAAPCSISAGLLIGSTTSGRLIGLEPSSLMPIYRFPLEELIEFSVDDEVKVTVHIGADRNYFSLDKIIDLETQSTVPADRQRTVDAILRGERPPGSDWQITVGKAEAGGGDVTTSRHVFHVHRSTLVRASPVLARAIDSAPADRSSCNLASLTAEDMRVVIPLIYGCPPPLPAHPDRVPALIRSLGGLFESHLLSDVLYPQWERAICREALAIDKCLSSSSIASLARLLSLVWHCPFGSMPTAKRVAIGVMADMMHLSGHTNIKAIAKAMSPIAAALGPIYFPVCVSAFSHYRAVVVVSKRLLQPTIAAEEESASDEGDNLAAAAAARPAPSGAFVIDLPESDADDDAGDDDEDWHDAAAGEKTKWGCTIS